MLILEILCIIGGIFCLGYYIILVMTVGFGIVFSGFWPISAALLAAGAFCCHKVRAGMWNLPIGWRRLIYIVVAVGIVVFAALFLWVRITGRQKPFPGAKYCIVLGCKVNQDGPSLSLYYRIQAAEEYLRQSPETICIVSGGKGGDEPMSEADCIAEELIRRGIPEDRIIRETESFSTKENIVNSRQLMDSPDAETVIISSDYHMLRALLIARKQGLTNVRGFGAYAGPAMGLNYSVREVPALIKDWIYGNL